MGIKLHASDKVSTSFSTFRGTTCNACAQVRNVKCASAAALCQDVSKLQAEADALSAELEDVLGQFDAVQTDADAVEGEVVDEVCRAYNVTDSHDALLTLGQGQWHKLRMQA